MEGGIYFEERLMLVLHQDGIRNFIKEGMVSEAL